ncbi:MAG: hypothetical protein LBV66_02920, partial [Elusimicrobiota bacterium]|nr:hypothetical protein [Elusimicrobiota bacterium]
FGSCHNVDDIYNAYTIKNFVVKKQTSLKVFVCRNSPLAVVVAVIPLYGGVSPNGDGVVFFSSCRCF